MKITPLGFDSPIGGNMVYWQTNQPLIAKFIKDNALGPLKFPVPDLDIHGGIRVSHVHLANDIYLLNTAQWSAFTKGIMSDISRRLQAAPQVTFEEGMLLGTVAQSIASRSG